MAELISDEEYKQIEAHVFNKNWQGTLKQALIRAAVAHGVRLAAGIVEEQIGCFDKNTPYSEAWILVRDAILARADAAGKETP